jgi:hypothetical protein
MYHIGGQQGLPYSGGKRLRRLQGKEATRKPVDEGSGKCVGATSSGKLMLHGVLHFQSVRLAADSVCDTLVSTSLAFWMSRGCGPKRTWKEAATVTSVRMVLHKRFYPSLDVVPLPQLSG